MPKISPLASVDPNACLADDVEVGPFCLVGPNVSIGAGCKLFSHVVIEGHTTIGRNNSFHPHTVIGGPPQDLKYRGAPTRLEIGDDNHFRENVSVHTGTEKGGGITRIGNQNLLMVNCHIGHDCQIGSRCILSNNVMVAGHVLIGDNVAMMGGVGVHHFVTIGEYSYMAGYARIHHDVPPFVKVADDDEVRALNTTGLQRAGFSEADIEELKQTVRHLFYGEKAFAVKLREFDTGNGINQHVKRMVEFLRQRDTGRHGRYLESKRQG